MPQLSIDFTRVVHKRENNQASEAILNSQRERLSNQCNLVYEVLKSGKRLTVRDAMIGYGIGDLRRRVKDLIDHAGIDVKSSMIGNGFKEYFL